MEPKRAGFDDPDVEEAVRNEYELIRKLLAESERQERTTASAVAMVARAVAVLAVLGIIVLLGLVLIAAVVWDVGGWIWGSV